MPPIQHGCQFYSFNALRNSKPKEQAIEAGFHRARGHVQLLRNFPVVAPLQQQLDNLLVTRSQLNCRFLHTASFSRVFANLFHTWAVQCPQPSPAENEVPDRLRSAFTRKLSFSLDQEHSDCQPTVRPRFSLGRPKVDRRPETPMHPAQRRSEPDGYVPSRHRAVREQEKWGLEGGRARNERP